MLIISLFGRTKQLGVRGNTKPVRLVKQQSPCAWALLFWGVSADSAGQSLQNKTGLICYHEFYLMEYPYLCVNFNSASHRNIRAKGYETTKA
jgi:hypothetical protein